MAYHIDTGLIKEKFKVSTPGKFSSYNAISAILTCHLMGIDVKYIALALKDFSVKGRVEPVWVSDKFTLLIDYAHNGVSTESILTTIREYKPKRIVTIFGCGGNRSRDRRYEMGEIAGKYSDYCIITEDNNRYEEFNDIANDILIGMNKTDCEYKIISDRKEAIKYAIINANEGDVILLLGKGHEDYQIIGHEKIHLSDKEEVLKFNEYVNEQPKKLIATNKNSMEIGKENWRLYYQHVLGVFSKNLDFSEKNTILSENNDITIEELTKEFGEEVGAALSFLNHDKDVPYMDYVKALKDNNIARAVKMADLTHNMDLSRLKEVTDKDLERVKKYNEAYKLLDI